MKLRNKKLAVPFSIDRSTWSGKVADLMSPGPARPFVQPYFESIPTLPSNSGLPMGGIGSSYTLTPAGTTPVLSIVPGLHVTANESEPVRLHNFFFCEREPAQLRNLIIPDFLALKRKNEYYPLINSQGKRWFIGNESPERALETLGLMVNSESLYKDNAESFARWQVPWSPRTRRAIEKGRLNSESRLWLLLDFYGVGIGLKPQFARSLTGNYKDYSIDYMTTYRADRMHYSALYPLGKTRYLDRGHRTQLTKYTYTPLIAGDELSCSLPVSLVEFELVNRQSFPMEVTLLQAMENLCGYQVIKQRVGLQDSWFRLVPTARRMQNKLTTVEIGNGQMLMGTLMGQEDGWQDGDLNGSMFAGVAFDPQDPDISVTCNPAYSLDRTGHVTSEATYDGRLSPTFDKSLYTGREPLASAVCVTCSLPPRTSKHVTFVLTLDFPTICLPGRNSRKRYVTYFPRAQTRVMDMTQTALNQRQQSMQAAKLLHTSIGNSVGLNWLFPATADRARDQFLTCLCNLLAFYADSAIWTEEGECLLRESADYPFFNVLDVYFYGSFSLSQLLPNANAAILREFARAILAEDSSPRRYWQYTEEPFADLPDPKYQGPRAIFGAVPHDLGNPFDCKPDAYIWHNVKEWKDLAPKYVLLVLRQFRISGDRQFLVDCWPAVQAAMDYLSSQRQQGETIPLTRGNDDTFDNLPSYGISTYSGSLWIAGLFASAEIAKIIGHSADEKKWGDMALVAREDFVATLWDEKEGYYHFFATPVTAQDYCDDGAATLERLIERLQIDSCGNALKSINQFLNSSFFPNLSETDSKTAKSWVLANYPDYLPLLESLQLSRKDLRTLKKLLLVGLEPRLWTSRFLAKLSLDSDDILCAQLLADTWLELLDLPLITPKDRRRRILDRIMTMNFHTHSPAVGAANLVGRLGQTLDAAQAQDVWIGIQFGLVAALISADMRKEALEILDICYRNLYEKIRIPFAVPEGFNGNSALTAADLAYAMKLKTDEAEQLIAALTEHSIVEKNGRVSADVKTVTLKKLKTMLQQGSGLKILNHKQYLELLGLLHSWGLRYSAGRYHRPGMAYCILDMLARKSQESTQHPL